MIFVLEALSDAIPFGKGLTVFISVHYDYVPSFLDETKNRRFCVCADMTLHTCNTLSQIKVYFAIPSFDKT